MCVVLKQHLQFKELMQGHAIAMKIFSLVYLHYGKHISLLYDAHDNLECRESCCRVQCWRLTTLYYKRKS